ncbi:toxin secretion/phage lysis holin [Carboxydothermus islandicus]|uniref:Toxin secretion/phage lysis holin n=1 Tax=Carboxydothermus islandicus TaxID=661089 RepID=A0A1L8D107_9THEO|nr:phage holin family protein [Carboxydothermus islandicus]GAV24824.1 toxin secretion/phage lysis holin [Carboxydothermus islandicus]
MKLDYALDYGRYVFAALGTVLVTLLGGWDKLLQVLVLFVVTDYITGVVAAWFEKRLSSEVGAKGILKKLLIFAVVAIATSLDKMTGTNEVFRSLVVLFYVSNEGLSVIENLGKCGVPVPGALKEAILKLKEGEKNVN